MPDHISLSAAQLERIQTLMTVREIRRVEWDVLGEVLVVLAGAGQPGRLLDVPVSLTPEAAEALWSLLGEALQERAAARGRVQ